MDIQQLIDQKIEAKHEPGIYGILSPTGKLYIGQSIKIKRRWWNHKSKNVEEIPKLSRSLSKYGKENHLFFVIEYCDESLLADRECYWINLFNTTSPKHLNSASGGRSPKHSEETKQKIRERMKGKKYSLGIKRTKEQCMAISERNRKRVYKRGYKLSPDHIEKMRIAMMGNKHGLGHRHSDEFKKQISERQKGAGNSSAKKVRNIETGQVFNCMEDAAAHEGVVRGTILRWIKGNNKRTKIRYEYV